MKPGVPRLIYSLWLQGRDRAPDLVRLNLARWETLNPGYRVKVLEATDVHARLDKECLAVTDLAPQALSDILRCSLLLETGGIWVDASLFPMRPLDDWLDDAISESAFFAFERPGPDRPLSSWFLATNADNLILHAWWSEVKRYWSRPRRLTDGTPDDPVGRVSPDGAADDTYPYFWFHYLFAHLVQTDPEVAASWDRCAKWSAGPPHELQALFAHDGSPSSDLIRQVAAGSPVHKLNWRATYPYDVLAAL